jgi:superfamily II DNA or RNA helicase
MPLPSAAHPDHRVALPTLEAIKARFGPTTWARGQQYERARAVLHVEILLDRTATPPEFEVNAEVMGSKMDPYEQHILLWPSDTGHWLVDGDCSCPVGHNCKHVAAALVHVLSQDWFNDAGASNDAPDQPHTPPPPAYAAWNSWLHQAEAIHHRHQQTDAAPLAARGLKMPWEQTTGTTAEYAYFIVLSTCQSKHQPGHWLTLSPGKARKLKNKPGQLGKVVQPPAYNVSWGTSEGQGRVYELARRWYAGQANISSWHYHEAPSGLPHHAVRDAVGKLVLEQAARAGELVTLTDNHLVQQRVQWGPALQLQWAWSSAGLANDGNALWALTPHLVAPDGAPSDHTPKAQIFMGEPLLYLDSTHGTCGTVEAPGTPLHDVQRWLATPPMPEAWMRQHSLRLSQLLPHLPPALAGDIARHIQGVTPTPCLHITAHPQPSHAVFQIDLLFDYDGVKGNWGPEDGEVVKLETAEGTVNLRRDMVTEYRVIHDLIAQGYRPMNPRRNEGWQAADDDALVRPHARDLMLLDADFAPFREAGFRIEIDEALRQQLLQTGEIDLALQDTSTESGHAGNDWFSLSLGFTVGEQRINLLTWLPQLIEQWSRWQMADWPTHAWITDDNGHPWRVPTEPLRPWMGALMELTQERGRDMAGEAWQLDRFEALRLATVDAGPGQGALALSVAHAQSLSALVNALRQPNGLAPVAPPDGLQAHLRPYQQDGLNWMQHLGQHHLGGILADDMGLGKTVQTIAHLLVEKQQGRLNQPALIVAPTSLVGNWQSELARFAPTLKVLILHGQQRHQSFAQLPAHDIAITTYPLLLRDEAVLTKTPWSVVVLDEAQAIKNARTRMAAIVQALPAQQRLCLTGTPMENHLGEVWSLFNFLKQVFRTPIEKHGDTQRMALLRTRLAPFMLRRTKAAVATELPPKIETVAYIALPPAQANLYEVIRVATEAKIQAALQSKGLARSQIAVLDALLKLRQVCCDPRLVPLEAAKKVKESAKLNWLLDNLPAMIEEGRRVLLFSQFTSMLSLIEEALQPTGLTWAKLTGQSQKRDAIVARFTSGQVPLFLISLKAGGVGLNLPQADTVIHFDPWWNPAVEDQATDRAHRMGQQSTVFVHKLVAQGTLEERILAMQARKAALAQGLHGGGDQAATTRLTEEDLSWLLQPIGAAGK